MLVNILICIGILSVIAVLAALLLAVSEHYLQVNDNEEQHEEKIAELLPGYNCGACGHINCRQFAHSVMCGKVKSIDECRVITKENANVIIEYCKENNIKVD